MFHTWAWVRFWDKLNNNLHYYGHEFVAEVFKFKFSIDLLCWAFMWESDGKFLRYFVVVTHPEVT